MKKRITIFTPTYNRCHTLPQLYDSLCSQSNKNFCWLVVDDGSTDCTEELLSTWINERKIEIVYIKQENSGKSMAFNKGISLCNTELFTCVDSDDYLTDDAVDLILMTWLDCVDNCVGILCLREVSSVPDKMKNIGYTTLRDAYCKYGLKGDTMLVHKTDIIKKYRFPNFTGEKFVPEDYLYDKIDQDGKLMFFNKVLYRGKYLNDGYTCDMAKLIKNNPKGYNVFITQRLLFDYSLKQIIFDIIRLIAINQVLKYSDYKTNIVYPVLYFLLYPFGFLLFFLRYKFI